MITFRDVSCESDEFMFRTIKKVAKSLSSSSSDLFTETIAGVHYQSVVKSEFLEHTVETDTVIDKIWHEHRFVFFILSELNTLAKFHYLSDTNLFYLKMKLVREPKQVCWKILDEIVQML